MNKKILLPLALLGVGAAFMFLSKGNSSNLEKKRNGEILLSDSEAENYLNRYGDLSPYFYNHPHLMSQHGSIIEWAKHHWANHGRFEQDRRLEDFV